jgi:Domain of unknown function (DUF4124)
MKNLLTVQHACSCMLAITGLLISNESTAQVYKCKDDGGRIIFSDAPCRPPTPPKPVPAPAIASKPLAAAPAATAAPTAPVATINSAINGKLTESLVASILRHASDLGMQSDYRAQCALAAPDLKINLTDHSSRPATVIGGGRKEMCDAQRDSATVILAAQIQPNITWDKEKIVINSAGTQAVATYDSITTLRLQGQIMMRLRCNRKETLAVYQDKVLYSDVVAVCRPQ